MVSIILKQALKKFKTSKEWELLQEYAGSEQAQADWELANSPEGKRLYKKAIASVKSALIASALLKNAEKKPVEIPRKMRVLPLASITKNVGLNSKFDRERASVYNYYLNKYIEMIDSLDHNSPRIDLTQARNIALKKFDIDNNFPVLMEAERWHLYVKEKKRIVKTEEAIFSTKM